MAMNGWYTASSDTPNPQLPVLSCMCWTALSNCSLSSSADVGATPCGGFEIAIPSPLVVKIMGFV